MPVFILIFFLSLMFPFYAQGQALATAAQNIPNLPSLKPDDQHSFDNFIKAMKELEMEAFLKGQSIFNVKTVTPRQIILDYKKGTDKADKIYKGKQIRIKAIVANFGKNAFNKYFIETHGDTAKDRVNIFINPRDSRYMQHRTGTEIDLVCYGQGVDIAFPSFDQCLFATDYFNKQYRPIEQHIASATQANYMPASQKELSTIILYKVLEPKIKDVCNKSIDDCRDQTIIKLQEQAPHDTEAAANFAPIKEKYADLPPLPALDDAL